MSVPLYTINYYVEVRSCAYIYSKGKYIYDTHVDAFANIKAGCEVHLMLSLFKYFELNSSIFCDMIFK